MTIEEATAYFKSFYQFGPMTFPEVYAILKTHGWLVQLVQEKRAPVWVFTQVK